MDSDLVRMPEFARRGHKTGEKVYSDAYHFTNNRDLVVDFYAASVRPLRDSFGYANDQLEMVDFGVEGIGGPICCPKVVLASKKKTAGSFVVLRRLFPLGA